MAAGRPTSFRLSDQARKILDDWNARTGLKRSAIVEMALREMHRKAPRNQPEKKSEEPT